LNWGGALMTFDVSVLDRLVRLAQSVVSEQLCMYVDDGIHGSKTVLLSQSRVKPKGLWFLCSTALIDASVLHKSMSRETR
jgi:hypothetical protein